MNEGNAVIYCEGAFNTTNGKTAHGLIRHTRRYNIVSLIDSRYAGQDAGKILDNKPNQIPILSNLDAALQRAKSHKQKITHFVIGLAPDGGRLDRQTRGAIIKAIQSGLNVDAGLHDFLTEDKKIMQLIKKKGVLIRDIRKTPSREKLHFFCGKISEVNCLKIAILGTDSAVGKRTTAWKLLESLTAKGIKTELIGTGQTAWMQGVKYSIILDSLINDFVAGEIEHVIWEAWKNEKPDAIIIEGQGSIMHPAYPGGFEILTAGRPDLVIVQHAPGRKEYDGFPGYKIHPLKEQIRVIELLCGKPVVGITINSENLNENEIKNSYKQIRAETGLPVCNPLVEGLDDISEMIIKKYSLC
jgi:uncharacterized NAD-dependent epimerase/dehydratase family protein